VQIAPASGLAKQRELYDWADLVVVPLRPNFHASGITVVLEAVALGKPLVVTDAGGLKDYFSGEHAAYVPPHDPLALRRAVDGLVARPEQALSRAWAAGAHLMARNFTTQHFAHQHVRITQELLRQRGTLATGLCADDLSLADNRPSN
jgi:glycosyltransferase involved in cell wall biosynthesis